MSSAPGPMDLRFVATIGVDVRGELWSCVEVPESRELLGTGKAVKVVASVDNEPLTVALMPTGAGGHMLSISARLRKRIDKGVGDEVAVHISERLT